MIVEVFSVFHGDIHENEIDDERLIRERGELVKWMLIRFVQAL